MIKGIDISTFQKNLNYDELKRNGVEFAIIRTGYGKDENQKDDMFETHYEGCRRAGIKVGAYLYSYCTAIENAEKEANNCLRHIAGKSFDLPIFLDLEEQRTAILGKDAVNEIASIFCSIIKGAGYKAGVYANLNWFNNYIDPYSVINEGNYIWLSQWNNEITATFPIDIWQNTNKNEFGFDGDYLINESLFNNDVEPELPVNVCQSLAVDVIYGRYGNGQERKNALGSYYEEVQNIVNDIYEIVGG